jgi:hypothetical protein
MDQVERLPRYFTNTVYNFYFSPGDSFKSHLNWLQSSFSNNIYTDLKVFSGKYYITASQPGLSSNKIGKWIEIEENGEPLSSKLYWYFGDQDSVKLGFLIRNRISKKLEYQLKMNEAIKIKFFRNESDTLSNEINVSPDFNNIILEAKSDNKVFTFRESKNKLIDKGISGSYYCMIEINCVSTIISARALVIIN